MNLRSRVLHGGAYLALRQGLGMVIGFGGLLVLTRTIGAENYGLYAAALGIYKYSYDFTQLGIGVYLIRGQNNEQRHEDCHQAFTLLLVFGISVNLVALLGLPFWEQLSKDTGFTPIIISLFLGLPIHLLALIPLARLERALNYRLVAITDLIGQIVYYLVALTLAFQGFGVWAPVGGWWSQKVVELTLLYQKTQYRPHFYWDWKLVRQMVGYGIGYSSSMWVWHLRQLVNPLVVLPFLGKESAGYVDLAIQLVERLSFLKNATWRLSLATLSHLQADRTRLVQAIGEGMRLQILAIAPLLVGFACVAPWLFPLFWDKSWLLVLQVYPFIALSYLTNALFNLHSATLYVLKRNWEVTLFHFAHIALFAGGAYFLVPQWGIIGYGAAEVLAILSYIVIHAYIVRYLEAPDYRLAGIWWVGMSLPLFWQQLGAWTFVSLPAVLLSPGTLSEIRRFLANFKRGENR